MCEVMRIEEVWAQGSHLRALVLHAPTNPTALAVVSSVITLVESSVITLPERRRERNREVLVCKAA